MFWKTTALRVKPRGVLTDRQARKVNALKDGSRAFAIMRGLAMRFNGILRSTSSRALDEWIDDAIDTELTAIMRFASGASPVKAVVKIEIGCVKDMESMAEMASYTTTSETCSAAGQPALAVRQPRMLYHSRPHLSF